MGYTHYWYRTSELDPDLFKRWVEDLRSLHDNLPAYTNTAGGYYNKYRLTIHGPDGIGPAVMNDNEVAFNGRKCANSVPEDLYHETFYLSQNLDISDDECVDETGPHFEFCKTARKPYDLLVTAALVALKHHFSDVDVQSDGDASDWIEDLALTRQVLSYGELPFPHQRSR